MQRDHEAEIDARLSVALARAHRPLTPVERTLVREAIVRDLRDRDELRSIPLANGDAPDPPYDPAPGAERGATW